MFLEHSPVWRCWTHKCTGEGLVCSINRKISQPSALGGFFVLLVMQTCVRQASFDIVSCLNGFYLVLYEIIVCCHSWLFDSSNFFRLFWRTIIRNVRLLVCWNLETLSFLALSSDCSHFRLYSYRKVGPSSLSWLHHFTFSFTAETFLSQKSARSLWPLAQRASGSRSSLNSLFIARMVMLGFSH